MEHVCDMLYVSERRACRVLGQQRSTQCHHYQISDQEELLTVRIIELATTYGRYGYRLITGLLRNEGWNVNHKRVEGIWRKEGLKVPKKQPRRGRLWLNDGSRVRLRPEHKNHVWSYDLRFVGALTLVLPSMFLLPSFRFSSRLRVLRLLSLRSLLLSLRLLNPLLRLSLRLLNSLWLSLLNPLLRLPLYISRLIILNTVRFLF